MFSEPYEDTAYCSGQCQASRYPPSTCRCPCMGRNHGVLRNRVTVINPLEREFPFPEYRIMNGQPVPYLIEQPKLLPSPQDRATEHPDRIPGRGLNLTPSRGKYRLAKALGRSFKHAVAGYSETEMNARVYRGLRQQFNEENVEAAIAQAFTVYYQRVGSDTNRPELYELYENGDVDRALDVFGKRWVIGRPKH